MPKRILVTGGAGFIGTHLITRLLREGHEVVCLDNLQTGQKRNLALFNRHRRLTFVQHDVVDPITVEGGFDQIYNLACPASPVHYQADPIKTIMTSFMGAVNVLELARATGATVLQASTSEVYGDPTVHPQPEGYHGNVNPIGIRSCYDEGKRAAEALFFDYHRQHKVDIRIVRIFNTYGPHMRADDGRVVSNFITQALTNQDITLYGNGAQTRSFQYVDDLIEGMYRMMNQETLLGPVNIGNPDEFTVRELAEVVLEMIPESTSRLTFRDLPQDDPRQRKPDNSLAKAVLNWQPDVELREGLIKTIEHFRNVLDIQETAPAHEQALAR